MDRRPAARYAGVFGGIFFLDKVTVSFHENGQLKEFLCTITRYNDPNSSTTFSSNKPLDFGGGKLHLVSRMHGDAVRFQAVYPDGQIAQGNVIFSKDNDSQNFVVPRTAERVWARLIPEPAGVLELSRGVMVRQLKPGDRFWIGDIQLVFLEQVPWVGMIISRDPGRKYVYAGFILITLGLVTYYVLNWVQEKH